jgi:hypothetical protein
MTLTRTPSTETLGTRFVRAVDHYLATLQREGYGADETRQAKRVVDQLRAEVAEKGNRSDD